MTASNASMLQGIPGGFLTIAQRDEIRKDIERRDREDRLPRFFDIEEEERQSMRDTRSWPGTD